MKVQRGYIIIYFRSLRDQDRYPKQVRSSFYGTVFQRNTRCSDNQFYVN